MARPPTESDKIDKAELEKLMRLYPTEQEAADWFGVQFKTMQRYIRKHFGCSFVQLREKSFVRTRVGIKRAQIEKALKGDNTMLIWCGKQYLGQAEKLEQRSQITGKDGGPIETRAEVVALTDEQQVKIAEAILSAKRK